MDTTRFLALLLAWAMLTGLCACSAPLPSPPSPDPVSASASVQSGAGLSSGLPTDPSLRESSLQTPSASEEELRRKADEDFLQTIVYPSCLPGEEGQPYFSGRWFDKEIDGVAHKVTLTDGSQIFFLVEGAAAVNLDFTVITGKQTPYFSCSIDGGEPVRQKITEPSVSLPDQNRHLVRIFADGMVESEGKWNNEIGFALKEIVLPQGGRLCGAVPQNKRIFFYGDSITEGIAALAPGNTSDQNSATAAFPRYCAEQLGAIPYYIGYGASGVTVQGSFSTFQNAIDYLSFGRKVSTGTGERPDLIVVNHGTNDPSGGGSSGFRSALKRALTLLTKRYPGVEIVYLVPFGGYHRSDIETVAEGFENVTVVSTDGWGLTYNDGLHPNRAGAKRAGEKLAAAIRERFPDVFPEN